MNSPNPFPLTSIPTNAYEVFFSIATLNRDFFDSLYAAVFAIPVSHFADKPLKDRVSELTTVAYAGPSDAAGQLCRAIETIQRTANQQ